jgi:hypothetical protein
MVSVELIQDIEGKNEKSLECMKKKSGLADLILPDDYPDILEALIKAQPNTLVEQEAKSPPPTQLTDSMRSNGEGKFESSLFTSCC